MKPKRRHGFLLWMLVCSGLAEAIEPISTSIAVGMAAALTGFLASYPNILYYFHECCRPEWISFNRTGKLAKLPQQAVLTVNLRAFMLTTTKVLQSYVNYCKRTELASYYVYYVQQL